VGDLGEGKALPRPRGRIVSDRKPPARDPEDDFFDAAKRKSVVVEKTTGTKVTGTLMWISRYSIGVSDSAGSTKLIMKGAISEIEMV
jgi:sRNA-binding regulator protein Hfq